MSDLDRLLAKVDATGPCMEWNAALTADGYGRFWLDGRVVKAHRAAWMLLVGPCPKGLHPDHQCRNRRCIDLDHLDWVPPEVNNERSGSASARNRRAVSCPQKHPYDTANTLWRMQKGRPRRECRTCVRKQARTRQRRHRRTLEPV